MSVEPLIDETQIRERLVAMGRQIEEDYRDKPLTIVAVLTGSLIALADLIRQIRIPLRIALLQASSYRGATTTATALVINEAFAPDVAGRDVLLLDDILDTGQTLSNPRPAYLGSGCHNGPHRRAAAQDRPAGRADRAGLLRLRDPRRLRRRLRTGLQRRVPAPAVCRGAPAVGRGVGSRQHETGTGDTPVSAADRGRRESLELPGRGPGGRGSRRDGAHAQAPGMILPVRRDPDRRDRHDGRETIRRGPPDGGTAGDLEPAILGDVAVHAEPRAMVRDNPVDLAYVSMLKHDAYVDARGRPTAGFSGRPAARRGRPDGRHRLARVGQFRTEDRAAGAGPRDAFVAISKAVETELREAWRGGTLRNRRSTDLRSADTEPRIVSLPNGVPDPDDSLAEASRLAERAREAFVGRLAPEKGLDTLIDAWPIVRTAHPEARLILIGEGPERASLEARVAARGLTLGPGRAVEMPGVATDATAALRDVNLFVLPSPRRA